MSGTSRAFIVRALLYFALWIVVDQSAKPANLVVGVLGAGAMGRGIAQVAAAGGMHVLLHDAKPGAAAEAREFIGKMFQRAAEKGQLSEADAAAALGRPHAARTIVGTLLADRLPPLTLTPDA